MGTIKYLHPEFHLIDLMQIDLPLQGESAAQGCQIFFVQNTKTGENIPNDHTIYQMAIKYFQWP
jgi:hypothetical protein